MKDVEVFVKQVDKAIDQLRGICYSPEVSELNIHRTNEKIFVSFEITVPKQSVSGSNSGVRLSDKYNRIEHLITNHELKENDESLEDTLLDTAGYAILGLKYLEEHKNEKN